MGNQGPFAGRRSPRIVNENKEPGASELTVGRVKSSDDIGGHGLALHSTMMAVIGGFLKVESAPGQHTRVILELPETAWHSWV